MPWRGPEVPGEFPSLGYLVADWIEARCAIPDRDQVGDPFLLTDEQLRFLLWHYRINPDAHKDAEASEKLGRTVWRDVWHFGRGSQLVRPQKWGKGPFSGTVTCAEAAGPVVFDGWDAAGEPVGRPWPTPLIQITALSEDQTDNVWTALLPMIELGDFEADIPDTGLLRIYLPSGGRIEPVTSSARSRLGQRVTFLVQDQTESWVQTNGGRALADNQRRNIAGMGGRWLSTCNAWDPTEESVAQYTAEEESKHGGVYLDDLEPPDALSIRNKAERRRALKKVYGDSWWVDLDRISAEIDALMQRDAAQAERFFLNRKQAAEAKAFRPSKIKGCIEHQDVPERTRIVLGVDGARFRDAIAIIATVIDTGYQFVVDIIERPANAPDDYEHDLKRIDGAVQEAFSRYKVRLLYADPQRIGDLMDRWVSRWGNRVKEWHTHIPRRIVYAVRRYTEAIEAGDISFQPHDDFIHHLKNAVRHKLNVFDDEGRQMHTITKDRPKSPNKIDAAMAGVISWEARGDAIAKARSGSGSFVTF